MPFTGPTLLTGDADGDADVGTALRRLAADCERMTLELARLAESAARSPGIAPAASAVATGTARILVADDETVIRASLTRYLVKLGHDITQAADGVAALEMARRESFDLVLTDMHMPGMDGLSLLRELKSDDATRHVPVIVLSGQDDTASVVECLKTGADDYVAKPFELAVLQARVTAAIDRKRLHDLDRRYRARVAKVTAAAEAVEQETYASAMLAEIAGEDDELARLARVFDRMVNGLKSREERLQHRLSELRREMSAATDGGSAPGEPSEEHSHLRTGETFARRYEILGILGTGGMGTVYRASDSELQEHVAIKVVRPDIIKSDPSIVDRLKSEIRLARKLSHPNVVRAHDLGEWNGTYFISMEYVHGLTVADLLDRRGRLGVAATLAIGTQVAQALAVAHDAQIVHRDIKPANLLIDNAGVLKVMDFGIAVNTQRTDQITQHGFIVGTPHYMAPEQLVGGSIDARTDLFALGVVLYECLSGRPPFGGGSVAELLSRLTSRVFVPLAQLARDVPPALDRLVSQLLEFHANRRPDSARAVAACLAEIELARPADTPDDVVPIELEIVAPL